MASKVLMLERTRTNSRVAPSASSGDRILAVLSLFTVDEPEWSVEAAAERLGTSSPTVYRYFRSLARVGLISSSSRAGYVLGPAIIELDRQIRLCDPLLAVGRPIMDQLIEHASEGSAILLCRLYRNRVVCIHQVVGRGPQGPVSYERGRPMPLFRGATSKIVLAHLPPKTIKYLYQTHAKEIEAAGLGTSWESFRKSLAELRRSGAAVTHGEIDRGRVGIAAPIFGSTRNIIGSLSFVLPAYKAKRSAIHRVLPLTTAAAKEIESRLGALRMRRRAAQKTKLNGLEMIK